MVGTVRRELLDRVLVVNARQLLRLLATYAMHYNQHRPHQARQQRPPDTTALPVHSVTHLDTRRIRRHPVLGSTINEYRHAA